ncbi:MAG: tRNA epoxyqueuosine(34) reductase QueG, partial [Gammaproteobacteria bacterium]|nr:tRNA epoxyqueuosine(34) reductase QueG [Gammaproteobacteria bacterium]
MVALTANIKQWANELGFDHCGITDVDLSEHEPHLKRWLARKFHGSMNYMANHGNKRSRPNELIPNTLRAISVRLNYWPKSRVPALTMLSKLHRGYIARYALGRDYHKVMRLRLKKLAARIENSIGHFGYRGFVDSGPVLERALAAKAGLGWIGKHTNLIDQDHGSWFFIGELLTDLPLPIDQAVDAHCGSCTACIEICPTQAITAPYELDARRCISYLTIENRGSIPEQFRAAIG